MKTQTVKKLAALAITLASVVAVTPVFAQSTSRVAPPAQTLQKPALYGGKTREEVKAELLQAKEAGMVSSGHNDYPPTAATIERNRIAFAQAERAWKQQTEVAKQ